MKTEPNESIHASTEVVYYGSEDQWRKEIFHEGLTKREHFASKAMLGLLSANATYNGKTDDREKLANDAVAHADALIKALNAI